MKVTHYNLRSMSGAERLYSVKPLCSLQVEQPIRTKLNSTELKSGQKRTLHLTTVCNVFYCVSTVIQLCELIKVT